MAAVALSPSSAATTSTAAAAAVIPLSATVIAAIPSVLSPSASSAPSTSSFAAASSSNSALSPSSSSSSSSQLSNNSNGGVKSPTSSNNNPTSIASTSGNATISAKDIRLSSSNNGTMPSVMMSPPSSASSSSSMMPLSPANSMSLANMSMMITPKFEVAPIDPSLLPMDLPCVPGLSDEDNIRVHALAAEGNSMAAWRCGTTHDITRLPPATGCVPWLVKAIEAGSILACGELGILKITGQHGVDVDVATGNALLARAYEGGCVHSQLMAGVMAWANNRHDEARHRWSLILGEFGENVMHIDRLMRAYKLPAREQLAASPVLRAQYGWHLDIAEWMCEAGRRTARLARYLLSTLYAPSCHGPAPSAESALENLQRYAGAKFNDALLRVTAKSDLATITPTLIDVAAAGLVCATYGQPAEKRLRLELFNVKQSTTSEIHRLRDTRQYHDKKTATMIIKAREDATAAQDELKRYRHQYDKHVASLSNALEVMQSSQHQLIAEVKHWKKKAEDAIQATAAMARYVGRGQGATNVSSLSVVEQANANAAQAAFAIQAATALAATHGTNNNNNNANNTSASSLSSSGNSSNSSTPTVAAALVAAGVGSGISGGSNSNNNGPVPVDESADDSGDDHELPALEALPTQSSLSELVAATTANGHTSSSSGSFRAQKPCACLACYTMKMKCDGQRPCERCRHNGRAQLCLDRPRKKPLARRTHVNNVLASATTTSPAPPPPPPPPPPSHAPSSSSSSLTPSQQPSSSASSSSSSSSTTTTSSGMPSIPIARDAYASLAIAVPSSSAIAAMQPHQQISPPSSYTPTSSSSSTSTFAIALSEATHHGNHSNHGSHGSGHAPARAHVATAIATSVPARASPDRVPVVSNNAASTAAASGGGGSRRIAQGGACSICHAHKTKCSGGRPCDRCRRMNRADQCRDRATAAPPVTTKTESSSSRGSHHHNNNNNTISPPSQSHTLDASHLLVGAKSRRRSRSASPMPAITNLARGQSVSPPMSNGYASNNERERDHHNGHNNTSDDDDDMVEGAPPLVSAAEAAAVATVVSSGNRSAFAPVPSSASSSSHHAASALSVLATAARVPMQSGGAMASLPYGAAAAAAAMLSGANITSLLSHPLLQSSTLSSSSSLNATPALPVMATAATATALPSFASSLSQSLMNGHHHHHGADAAITRASPLPRVSLASIVPS